jgi:TolA-binding protein
MRRFPIPTISLLATLLLSGCFYPAERGKMMEERLNRLEASNQDLQTELEKQTKRLDEQVALVKETIDKLEQASRRSSADIGVQVEQMHSDMAALRGQLEEQVYKLKEIQSAIADLKSGRMAAGGGDGGVSGAGAAATPTEKPPADKRAFAELVIKRLGEVPEEGRSLAGEWLRKWPNDSLASGVHYAIGVSYYDEKNCRAALAEFGALLKSFSKSEQAPDALLKSSDCFNTLGMKEEARMALEEITNGYPKSDAAARARDKLAALKKAKPSKATKPRGK